MDDFDYSTHPSPQPAPVAAFPPKSWPTKDQLDYARLAMTVFLLSLGTGWVVYMLFKNPKNPQRIIAGAGLSHVNLPGS